jgi:cytochrome P450
MTQPWTASGFPPLADRAFDLDLDEESFSFIGDAFARFGDIVGVAPVLRRSGMVLVNRPDEAWHVLGSNHTNYVKGVGARKVRMLLGKGLIAIEGKAWRDRRRVLQPSFHEEAIAGLADVMVTVNLEMLERWRAQAAAGEPIDVSTDTARLTLEIIVHCLFGEDLDDLVAAAGDIPFAMLADDLNRTLTTVHRLQEQRELVLDLIARRRGRGEERGDLLGVLLAARDAETGEPIDAKSVTDEVVTLAVAGHETSASALTWGWYLLSEHPQVEAALHAEVDAFPAPGPRTVADLATLSHLRRVLDETLRLYPPGWILTRRAIAADRIGPYRIPAGTDVLISPYYLHRNPELWPRPDAFDPDRFAGKPAHKHAYIPFGAGPRRCIGDVFGLVEMQLHLALTARRLRLCYLGGAPPRPEARVNLRPKERLLFRGELRD